MSGKVGTVFEVGIGEIGREGEDDGATRRFHLSLGQLHSILPVAHWDSDTPGHVIRPARTGVGDGD